MRDGDTIDIDGPLREEASQRDEKFQTDMQKISNSIVELVESRTGKTLPPSWRDDTFVSVQGMVAAWEQRLKVVGEYS